jgi:mRNA interferase MazF
MRKTRHGKMPRSGDVVIARVAFADSREVKLRPALVLFEEMGNYVVAGITSDLKMKGIALSKKEGAVKDSVIKLNYIFTISEQMISNVVFKLSKEKRILVFKELEKRLSELKR